MRYSNRQCKVQRPLPLFVTPLIRHWSECPYRHAVLFAIRDLKVESIVRKICAIICIYFTSRDPIIFILFGSYSLWCDTICKLEL